MCSSEKEKKKKLETETGVAVRETGSHAVTWVAHGGLGRARPGLMRLDRRACVSISSSSSLSHSLSLSFLSFHVFHC